MQLLTTLNLVDKGLYLPNLKPKLNTLGTVFVNRTLLTFQMAQVDIPYEFAYSVEAEDGSHSHTQSSSNGRVEGSYSINLADGRRRVVR